MRTFSWRTALFGRYDVFHVHWPELLVRGDSVARTAAKRGRFVLLLARFALRRIPVVRTMHNVTAHEAGGRIEQILLRALERRTTLWIRLNPFTPVPDTAPVRTILHGHYRDWFHLASHPPPDRHRLLFFGLLRTYKGIEELLAAFAGLRDPEARLHIVGRAEEPSLVGAIAAAEGRDDRIRARIGYLPDEELAQEVLKGQLVVLPYHTVHNSGAALLALSLGRPVLMPETQTTRWLQAEVGERWVVTYRPPLTAEVLASALVGSERPGEPPALVGRAWPVVAAAHAEAFEAASHLVRDGQSRRYST